MYDVKLVLEIQLLYRQGNSLKSIARDTGYSINTVRRYVRDNKQPIYATRPPKSKKLDDFISYLKNRVKQASPDWIPATVLFGEIKAIGYLGGITLVRDYLCALKPTIKEYPLIRFETSPGEQMQVDFARFKYRDWVFYVFYDFAKHYCFIPRICKPYRPQTKGKIERMVSYLRYSFYTPFVAGKQNLNLDELNIGTMDWLNNIANQRVHATTKAIPKERWFIEKVHLLNIPNSYCDNYGITNKNPITQQSNNIMDQNTHSLQHNLSVYDSILPLVAGGAL